IHGGLICDRIVHYLLESVAELFGICNRATHAFLSERLKIFECDGHYAIVVVGKREAGGIPPFAKSAKGWVLLFRGGSNSKKRQEGRINYVGESLSQSTL